MIKKILILVITVSSTLVYSQREKFQINGATRSYLFAKELDIDRSVDTITTQNVNYGHTLLDLGISAFPNDNTEVISIFRIRNELGGFWGGGVSFNVRQLTLNGVAGGIVKYNLGDIDLKLTPYTLYNPVEEGVVNEGDIFALRREIVHYDMFYNEHNSWRMQGANAEFGLDFRKGIENISFRGYLTRQRPTDGITIPERLYGGGTVRISQSEDLFLEANSISLFDLDETISDSIQYQNSVNTLRLHYARSLNDNLKVGFKSETGTSNVKYTNYIDPQAPDQQEDWFVDGSAFLKLKKQNINIDLGYKDVGADFFSPGAQTKRINFNRFPAVFQQYTNNFIGRPVNYNDIISGNAEYMFKISDELMAYNVAYSNITPYGQATPNRRGVYLNATREDSVKFRNSFLQFAQLSESRGSGTTQLKSFTSLIAGTDIYINDFINWEKQFVVNLGAQHEFTNRSGEDFEIVNFNSTFIDFGLSLEFLDKLDLMLGAKAWIAKGNEFITHRNRYNSVVDFKAVEIDFTEYTYAAGLRYRFSDKNTLSFHYSHHQVDHNRNLGVNYGISQFNILYSLMF